jgi:hypothetical protein
MMQPYAGMFLFFLLFEDQSEDHELESKVFQNLTDFDFIVYLTIEKIDDPDSYFDANRMLKLKDKLTPQAGQILTKVIKRFKDLAQTLNPSETLA